MSGAHRRDIEGLRGIAVLLAVGFHFGWVPGGFLGVDVFFVVSGYLITQLIVQQVEEGTFSFAAFYARRCRRILPALVVCIGVSLVVGRILLAPGDYARLGRSAVAAVAGFSNFFFLDATGYFDAPGELLPLLHTWSLAIEEQFYLVWPAVIALAMRKGARRWTLWGAVVLGCASVMASVVVAGHDPRDAFFLTHARVWELSLGAVAALAPRRDSVWRHGWAVLAILAIVVSAGFEHRADELLVVHVMPAAVGAAVIVRSSNTVMTRWLNFAPLGWIGRISYSLYLWHWPILVFYRHYQNGRHDVPFAAASDLLLAAVALAWLSWRLIESPARRLRLAHGTTIGLGLAAVGIVVLAGTFVEHTDAARKTLPEALLSLDRDTAWRWECPRVVKEANIDDYCVIGDEWSTATTRAVLWGDSHAEQWLPVFDDIGRTAHVSLAFSSSGACASLVRKTGPFRSFPAVADLPERCEKIHDSFVAFLRDLPSIDLVIVASNWSSVANQIHLQASEPMTSAQKVDLFTKELALATSEFTAMGKRVVVLGDTPWLVRDPVPCAIAATGVLPRTPCPELGDSMVLDPGSPQLAVHDALRRRFTPGTSTTYFPTMDWLCPHHTCPVKLAGELLYRDDNHIRRNLPADIRKALAARTRLAELFTQATR